jgi:pilus assembly protein TadC
MRIDPPSRDGHLPATRQVDVPVRYTESERPMKEVVSELWENTEVLVRNEIALGIAQLERKSEEAKTAITKMTASGVALHTGFVVLSVAAILLLNLALALWASVLIVGAALVLCGYALMPRGKSKEKSASGGSARRHQRAPTYPVTEIQS